MTRIGTTESTLSTIDGGDSGDKQESNPVCPISWAGNKSIAKYFESDSDTPSDDEEGDLPRSDPNVHFQKCTRLEDYPIRDVRPWPEHAMFTLREKDEKLWPENWVPDARGFVAMDAHTALQLRAFLLEGKTTHRWGWKPICLPRSCFEYPGSWLAPFRGLMISVYATTWIGLSESPSVLYLASRFETMKLILAAGAIYGFVDKVLVELDKAGEGYWPVPEPMRCDGRGREKGRESRVAMPLYNHQELSGFQERWRTETKPKNWGMLSPPWALSDAEEYLEGYFNALKTNMKRAKSEEVMFHETPACSGRGKKLFKALYEERAEDACYLIMMSITIATDFLEFVDQMGHNCLVGATVEPYNAIYYLGQQVREIMLLERLDSSVELEAWIERLMKLARQVVSGSSSVCGEVTERSDSYPRGQPRKKILPVSWHPSVDANVDFNREHPLRPVPVWYEPRYCGLIFKQGTPEPESEEEEERPRQKPRVDMIRFPCGCPLAGNKECTRVTEISREYADGTFLPTVLGGNGQPDYTRVWVVASKKAGSDESRAGKSRQRAMTRLRKHWTDHHNGSKLPVALRLQLKNGWGPKWGKVAARIGVGEETRAAWVWKAKRAFTGKPDLQERLRCLYQEAFTDEQYQDKIAQWLLSGDVVLG